MCISIFFYLDVIGVVFSVKCDDMKEKKKYDENVQIIYKIDIKLYII